MAPESRRFAHRVLTAEQIASSVGPAFPGKAVESFEILAGGACNTNYRVSLRGLAEPIVLRIYVRDPSAARREQALFRLVSSQLPVPEIFYVGDGPGGENAPYSIMRLLPGVTMQKAIASGAEATELGRETGQLLAALGRFPFDRFGFFNPDLSLTPATSDAADSGGMSYVLEGLEKPRAKEKLGSERVARIGDFIRRNAHYLEALEGHHCLTHGDFNTSNILVENRGGKWRISGLLDWEWAHSGSSLLDVANLLRELFPRYPGPGFEDPFIESYADAGGYLPPHWKKISLLLDFVNHVEFIITKGAEGADGADPGRSELIPLCIRWMERVIGNWDQT